MSSRRGIADGDDQETQPTGIYPLGGEGSRWAYMRDGLVIWAGGREQCELRFAVSCSAEATAPDAVLRAIARSFDVV